MSEEYEKALEAVKKASADYDIIRNAYRAMEIGDAEFLTGVAAYDEAGKIFDDAYSKEAGLENAE